MYQFLYPAVFFKDEEQSSIIAFFPDLNISIDGDSVEQAFLFAQDHLRVYLEMAIKHELDYDMPSDIGKIMAKYPKNQVMIVDTIIDIKKLKKAL